jgi:hypothetical protein
MSSIAFLTGILVLFAQAERRPLEQEAAVVALPRVSDELRFYPVARVTGHAELEALAGALTATEDARALSDALARLDEAVLRSKIAAESARSLVECVRARLQPPLADGQRVELVAPATLALVGSTAQHAWLAEFLTAAAAFEGLIEVKARVYQLAHAPGRPSYLARHGEVLGQEPLALLLAELDRGDVELVTAPRVLSYPFRENELAVLDQHPYVGDYELKTLPGADLEVFDPLVEVAEDGVRLRLRAAPLAGGRLGIEAHFELARLALPIRSVTKRIGAARREVTLQVPDVTRVRVDGSFEVRSGEGVLLAALDPSGAREVLALFVVQSVAPQESTARR